MKPTNDRAFKEWSAVVRALESGDTILIIRKGGIVEESGAFRIDDPEFFLFQNHTHQNAAELNPRTHSWLDASESDRPAEGFVRISSYAQVAKVWTVPDAAAVACLDHEHPWTRDYILERLYYKPNDPLFAIALRIYRLPEPVTLPYLRSYGGCTSWVTLDAPLSTEGALPAIDDAGFRERLARVEQRLKETGGRT